LFQILGKIILVEDFARVSEKSQLPGNREPRHFVILAPTASVGYKSWDLDATCALISADLPEGQHIYLEPIEG
jgi:hypothetical protein